MGNQNVVSNASSLDKGILIGCDQLVHERFKPIDKDLRYNLINDIAQTNRPKLIKILWNEGDEGVVKRFEQGT